MKVYAGDVIEVHGRPVAVTGCSRWGEPGTVVTPGGKVCGLDDQGATVIARRTVDGWDEVAA